MSGPWDRPPSPDDGDWPSEDIEPRSSADRPVEPWSAEDPWQERRDASPGWDEWPPPAPPTDDYVIDEPAPPSSDPWSESWSDDEPGIPASPPPIFDRPAFARAQDEPVDEPVAEQIDEPVAEPEPTYDAPRIQPWAPELDPWSAASVDWGPPAVEEPPPPDEPSPPELPVTADDEVAEPTRPEPEPEPAFIAPGPKPQPEVAAPEPTPITLLEPEPEFEAEPKPEPEPEPEPEPAIAEAAPEPEPAFEAEPEPEPGFRPFRWTTIEPPIALTPTERVEPALEPALEPAVGEPALEPSLEPAVAEPEPGPAAEMTPFEPAGDGDRDGAAAASAWEADLWSGPIEATAYATTEAEAEPEAEEAPEPEIAPEPEAWSERAAWPAAEPGIQAGEAREAAEPPWQDRGESTQVLPTSWSPPAPGSREATGELEPRTGDVRTSLGRDEPEIDEDEVAQPTTAEQAVPWLIGVILLLAGMVIVLLALIFAGDASLGGIGSAPSDSGAGLRPSGEPATSAAAMPIPRTSPRASPEESGEPESTPVAGPQYGPLEMIYQGRAAALAPIYLLLRDFTTEDEPVILAQDPNLDVRRFAWSPDGKVGAGLYADLLVSIEAGVEKRPLGDGMSAITFGDDASTVYGVRLTADGGNDVATVLSIDFASGDSSELASVSYQRPQIDDAAGLEEARFSDDGGAVRLHWMKDNTLRLWVLDGGSWSIEPSNGEATEVDEELPLQWSPDGRRRVSVMRDGRSTILRLLDRTGERLARTSIDGRVSHLRWSPDGKRVVFTVGVSASGGGVIQDLWLWDLGEGENPDPMRITDTGAAFGAEWRGAQPIWEGR